MSDRDVLLNLTQSLLEAILEGNWEAYDELCDPTLTCFEPEAVGNLIEGMEFHRFYFDGQSPPTGRRVNVTLASPHVRLMGDVAVVSYVRITQLVNSGSGPVSARCEETRVWEKQSGEWKHVHCHRSLPPT